MNRRGPRLGAGFIPAAAWVASLALGASLMTSPAFAQAEPGSVCVPDDGAPACEAVPPGPSGTPCFCTAPDGHGLVRGHRN